MKDNQKIFYLKIFLIFAVLALVGGLFLEIFFGNPQKSKWLYVFQKYYLKKELNWPKNYNGVWKVWNVDGELLVSTLVKDGVMHGEQVVWEYGGMNPLYLYKKQFYNNGNLHGKQEYFSEKNQLINVINWENGQKNGDYIQYYYDSNKFFYKEEFKNDILDGAYIEFYENGTKKIEGNYKNDMRIGEWCFWEENGTIIRKLNGDNSAEVGAILDLHRKFLKKRLYESR